MTRFRRGVVGVALAAAAAAGTITTTGGAAAGRAGGPLDVLLTNDDGVAAGYLDIVRDELCAAGHRVTVVAPSGDQSGNSSRFTSARGAVLRVTESTFACGDGTGTQHAVAAFFRASLGGGGQYTYDGPASPVDSVRFALDVVFDGEPPDLVVSGANPGQNLSSVVLKSGTVGAAMAAAAKDVPAIALSVAFNPADVRTRFANSVPAARALGAWTVDLIAELQQQQERDERLLPPGLALNVNYPTALTAGTFDPDAVGPAVLTVAGERDLIPIGYSPVPGRPGEYSVDVTLCGLPGSPQAQCTAPEVRDADTTAIERNRISVQPIDGDVTVQPPSSTGLRSVLEALNRR